MPMTGPEPPGDREVAIAQVKPIQQTVASEGLSLQKKLESGYKVSGIERDTGLVVRRGDYPRESLEFSIAI